MDDKNKHELPDFISLPEEREAVAKQMREAVADVQAAYKNLLNVAELTPIPTDIKEITTDWVKDKVEARMQLVRDDLSLTEVERVARLTTWSSLRARACRYVHTIERVLGECSTRAQWVYDEQIQNFYCGNVEELIEQASKHEVGEEAKKHYSLVGQALDAVRELRDWEDAHDVKSQPLADLQFLNAEDFARLWLDGAVKFDKERAQRYGLQVGNYRDAAGRPII